MARRVTRVEARQARNEQVRVIIYCRVSTDEQEDNGSSLETQHEDCVKYASEHGYTVLEVVKEAHSGYDLEGRLKLMDVLSRCKSSDIDAIVFKTYDRLSRNKTHFTVLMYEAQKYGYELLCVKEQFDGNNLFEAAIRDMVATFAEFERAKIQERTMNGRMKRAQGGSLLNGPKPRYGYTYADKEHSRYEIVESEAAIVRRIDELYLQGYSQHVIADMLTKEEIATPSGKNTIWSNNTVRLILTCTEYHGEGYAFKYEVVYSERGTRLTHEKPVDERVKLASDAFPPIRSYETYLKIQERIQNAYSTSIRSKVPKESLLRKAVYCSICGNVLTLCVYNNRHLHYLCYHAQTQIGIEKHYVQISASILEIAVLDYVHVLLQDLSSIEQALTAYIASHSAQSHVEAYDNAIAQVREKQKSIAQELKSTRGYARELLVNQLNELESEAEKLQEYKSQVNTDGGKWTVAKREMEEVLMWLRTGKAVNIYTASFEEKRRVLKALGIMVLVHKTPGRGKNGYEIRVTLPNLRNTVDSCIYR